MSKSEILSQVPDKIAGYDSHIEDHENPHQVTADQVGAYTKGETDDLLNDKADQSALNATNQEVSSLDGRVDAAESDIQALESSKANLDGGNTFLGDQAFNGPAFLDTDDGDIDVFAFKEITGEFLNDETHYIILGEINNDTRQHIAGRIVGINRNSRTNRDRFIIDVVYANMIAAGSFFLAAELLKNTNQHSVIRSVTLTYQSVDYAAIEIGNTTSAWYPSSYYFSAAYEHSGGNFPVVVMGGNVSNVQPNTGGGTSQKHFLVDQVHCRGTIRATEFITESHVESNTENALSALDNLPEWLTEDDELDYKKHYAYAPAIITDEEGNVIEETPGLSVEKRLAIMEKCLHEIWKEKLEEIKTESSNRIDMIADKIEAAGDLSQEIERKNIATEIRKMKNL